MDYDKILIRVRKKLIISMIAKKGQRDFKLLRGGKYSCKRQGSNTTLNRFSVKKLTEREKEVAAYFPLLGKPVRDLEALKDIIRKHDLAGVRIEDVDELYSEHLSIRSQNCLRNAKIRRFDKLLMMAPLELQALKNFGKKSLGELQEAARYILGIE